MAKKNVCSVVGCRRAIAHRDLCKAHYNRLQKTGDVQAHKPIRMVRRQHGEICTYDGCHGEYYAAGLCKRCYHREWAREARKCPEHRARHKASSNKSYHKYRDKRLAERRERYRTDEEYANAQRENTKRSNERKKRAKFAEIMGE